MQPPEVPDGTTLHGHAGVLGAIAAWPDQWDDYQLEIVQIVDAGSHVAVKTHQSGRGKGSGVAVEDEYLVRGRVPQWNVVEWRMFEPRATPSTPWAPVGARRLQRERRCPGKPGGTPLSISLSVESTKRLDQVHPRRTVATGMLLLEGVRTAAGTGSGRPTRTENHDQQAASAHQR